jgi:predicted ester cyclase
MSGTQNTEILHQAIVCFNAKDLDGYLQMFHASVLHHGFSRSIGPGVTGLRTFYRLMTLAFPDARIETDDVISEGEKLAHRYTLYGTHRAEYLGFPPTMKRIMSAGQVIHHFRDGKSIEVWAAGDILGLLIQIGAPNPLSRPR